MNEESIAKLDEATVPLRAYAPPVLHLLTSDEAEGKNASVEEVGPTNGPS